MARAWLCVDINEISTSALRCVTLNLQLSFTQCGAQQPGSSAMI